MPPASPTRHSALFPVILGACTLGAIFFVYLATIIVRFMPFYESFKSTDLAPLQNVGISIGQAFTFEPEIGLVLTSDAEGAFLIPKGEPVPFLHNSSGFRVSIETPHKSSEGHPRVMFLGDSFTYGLLVPAEHSFPYKTGELLGGAEVINAGVPGYGLASIVMQARKLIPEYKPDYVVVQYSPWFLNRAKSVFYQDSHKIIMQPYFYKNKDSIAIAPSPFIPPLWLIRKSEQYKISPRSFHDKISFIVTFALPFAIHLDSNMAFFHLSQWLGLSPNPTSDQTAIIKSSYQEIYNLARSHGGKALVVNLGLEWQHPVPDLLFPAGIININGWQALVSKLDPQAPEEYVRQYYHWRGTPPQPVDNHPSEKAHEVIAETLANRIKIIEEWRTGYNEQ